MPPTWSPGLSEVAPGVYAYIQNGDPNNTSISNAGFIVGSEGVIVIDALYTPSMARSLLAAIRSVTDKPVLALINTHHHSDHTYGNQFLGAQHIIGHVRCRELLLQTGPPNIERIAASRPQWAEEMREVRVTPPTLTFRDALTLYLDGRVIELRHPGPAHTMGDVYVYLPEEKVLFAGDLAFFAVTPLAFQGHVTGWLRALFRLNQLDFQTVVPGHGPLGGKKELAQTRDYFRYLRREALRRFRQGMTEAEAAQDIDLGPYAEWLNPERVRPNVARLYAEFRGELRGPS